MKSHLDRRTFLKTIARTGRSAVAAHAVHSLAITSVPAVLLSDIRPARTAASEPLKPPPEIRSESGVLRATITAAPGPVQIGAYAFSGSLYNGAYTPPLLRVGLGDTMRIKLRNNLPSEHTNLHYHGMSVSPRGNSDNVFIHLHPGDEFDYEVHIPAKGRQGPGFFWYHPHAHGSVNKQVLGGMSGGLIVEGSDQLYPILRGLPEKCLLVKHREFGEGNEVVFINGQRNPAFDIKPGEMQFWRIGHIGASLFIKFRIDGIPLYVVGRDGHPLTRPQKVDEFFIGPGERIDAIAIGPSPGEYAMTTIPFQNQAWREPLPAQQLATVISTGQQSSSANLEAEILSQQVQGNAWIDEVRASPIARRRLLTYSRTPDRQVFMIDGKVMEEDRIDQKARLGDTEEWTIVNTDQQYHSFHIHQTGFCVTEINGVRQDERGLRDTVSVPPATDAGPSNLKVAIPFTDPVIVGRFVYHCHASDHEDKGMMGVIEVVDS